jgi:hypothetical protein
MGFINLDKKVVENSWQCERLQSLLEDSLADVISNYPESISLNTE